MWLFCFFVKKLAGAPLSARTCLNSSHQYRDEEKLISSFQVVNYFLNMYTTGDIMAVPMLTLPTTSSRMTSTPSTTRSLCEQRLHGVPLYMRMIY